MPSATVHPRRLNRSTSRVLNQDRIAQPIAPRRPQHRSWCRLPGTRQPGSCHSTQPGSCHSTTAFRRGAVADPRRQDHPCCPAMIQTGPPCSGPNPPQPPLGAAQNTQICSREHDCQRDGTTAQLGGSRLSWCRRAWQPPSGYAISGLRPLRKRRRFRRRDGRGCRGPGQYRIVVRASA